MSYVESHVDVDVDVSTAYNQWTQFEDFPHFMEGVEMVTQIDDARLEWTAEIGPADRTWRAEITEQKPDEVIAWRAMGETRHDGRVTFEKLGDQQTRVHLRLDYDPQGVAEKAADAANIVDKRVEGDLERFKEFIEKRQAETGAWRGEIG